MPNNTVEIKTLALNYVSIIKLTETFPEHPHKKKLIKTQNRPKREQRKEFPMPSKKALELKEEKNC